MATVVGWLGCDLVTGQIIEELPDLTSDGPLRSVLGAYSSASLTLPIPLGGHGAPPREWEAATEPARTMVVAVLDERPVWAGMVLRRDGGSASTARLACASLEAYLDSRIVSDHEWVFEDEASVIAAGLIADANTVEGIGFAVDVVATGVDGERDYFDQDDKSVYSALRELMGSGGPEWTVVLDWTDDTRTAVSKTIVVRQRIGIASSEPTSVYTTGSASAVLAASGVSEARYELIEDYGSGRGANHIVATSSGEGLSRPQSSPARDEARLAIGPRFEYRYSPASSIADTDVLDAHAQRALAIMRSGARTLKITARADVYPVWGRDWMVGDDLGYDLIGHRHPGGLQGVARAIGVELDAAAGTVSPILFTPDVEG